jgi:hypothetical protein
VPLRSDLGAGVFFVGQRRYVIAARLSPLVEYPFDEIDVAAGSHQSSRRALASQLLPCARIAPAPSSHQARGLSSWDSVRRDRLPSFWVIGYPFDAIDGAAKSQQPSQTRAASSFATSERANCPRVFPRKARGLFWGLGFRSRGLRRTTVIAHPGSSSNVLRGRRRRRTGCAGVGLSGALRGRPTGLLPVVGATENCGPLARHAAR